MNPLLTLPLGQNRMFREFMCVILIHPLFDSRPPPHKHPPTHILMVPPNSHNSGWQYGCGKGRCRGVPVFLCLTDVIDSNYQQQPAHSPKIAEVSTAGPDKNQLSPRARDEKRVQSERVKKRRDITRPKSRLSNTTEVYKNTKLDRTSVSTQKNIVKYR